MFHWIYAANAQHSEKICNFEGFSLGNEKFLLDICCQYLRICWIYAANIWRNYVFLRVSVWGMNIFYWIYAANI